MLVQFDGDTKLGGKLAKMRALGFYFLEEDGITCNARSVKVSFEFKNALKISEKVFL